MGWDFHNIIPDTQPRTFCQVPSLPAECLVPVEKYFVMWVFFSLFYVDRTPPPQSLDFLLLTAIFKRMFMYFFLALVILIKVELY